MRVLLWSELYWPHVGGAELFLANLARALGPRGHEFLLVTSHHDIDLPDDDEHEGVPIRRLPFRAAVETGDVRRFPALVQRAAAIRREFMPDLVHLNAVGPSAFFALQSARVRRVPLLVTLQQEVLASQAGQAGTLLSRVFDAADWIAACSGAVLDQVRGVHPALASRSSCVYNGLEPPALAPAPLPSPPRLLCLGRLVPAKGFDIALRAFARLAPVHPAVTLAIAGDGVERAELEALAAELGLAGRVDFLGWVDPDAVPRLLNTATAIVMPSRREGMPLVAIQAAFMARPVVSTGVGGLPEVVIDGKTGFVIPPEDPEALAAAIDLLLTNPTGAREMGSRARDHVRSSLAWSNTVDAYDALYTTLPGGLALHAASV